MKKVSRLPHEQAIPESESGLGPEHGASSTDQDVEGHRGPNGDTFLPGMPGTGGDNLHRPISGGEIDGDDVEGHLMGHTKGERMSPGKPGTGGDTIAVEVDPDGDRSS
ncbi:MAG TPA: hypothetical protein VK194_07105 [Candidatus Deferrimicrobium sp.]|nr:hypothetical protein [Candidatus Deferrimicrobium sp.]